MKPVGLMPVPGVEPETQLAEVPAVSPAPARAARASRIPDVLIAAVLAAVAFSGSLRISALFPPVLYQYDAQLADGRRLTPFNLWFDADFPKIMKMVTDVTANYPEYNAKHPLQRSAVHGTVFALKRVGLEPRDGLRVFAAAGAAAWVVTLFALLRLMSCRRQDAALFSALGLVSASSMFWLGTPESFTLGSVTIMIALCLAAAATRHTLAPVAFVAASAISLSVTVTNWMAGILLSFFALPWRKALQYVANGFLIVTVLWAVQKLLIPNAEYFLAVARYDSRFLLDPQAGGPLRDMASFFAHAMVMPAIQIHTTAEPVWYGMSVQLSLPGSAGGWSIAALVLWGLLLGTGAYALARAPQRTLLHRVLIATLLLQLVLSIAYGRETFLYSLHFVPLLIVVAAHATLTRWRRPVLAVAALLVVAAAISNAGQLRAALDTTQRVAALAAPAPAAPAP